MAIAVSPRPGDAPLSASAQQIALTIASTSGATLTASILTPQGEYIPIEDAVLNAGIEHVVLSLPPGGVPPGSKLILVLDESDGTESVVKYTLK